MGRGGEAEVYNRTHMTRTMTLYVRPSFINIYTVWMRVGNLVTSASSFVQCCGLVEASHWKLDPCPHPQLWASPGADSGEGGAAPPPTLGLTRGGRWGGGSCPTPKFGHATLLNTCWGVADIKIGCINNALHCVHF